MNHMGRWIWFRFCCFVVSVAIVRAAQAAPPLISSFEPDSTSAGTTVSIQGLHFSSVPTNNLVYFGAVRGVVTAASATNLVVMAPVGATYAPITVTVDGLTGFSDQAFLPTFPASVKLNIPSFLPRVDLTSGAGPLRVFMADLDGDGKPDLVVADGYGGDLSIYQNISTNGVLAFAQPRVVLAMVKGTYANPLTAVIADLDGDGKPDIVALNSDSGFISIFRNITTPGNITTNSFSNRIDLPGGNGMSGLAVRDINGDGKPDIVTVNSGDNTISVFQNLSTIGALSFGQRVDFPTGNFPNALAVGDLDEDGNPDVVVSNQHDSTLSVFRNLGPTTQITTNSIAGRVDFPAAPQCYRITLGDVDGDGKPDILVANWTTASISIFRNLTSGPGITTNSFAPHIDFGLAGWGHEIALGDLDGDGKPDLVVVTELNSFLSIFHNTSTPGSFTTNSLGPRVDLATGWNPWGVSVGDLDGDGTPDLAFANTYDGTISIYLNSIAPPSISSQPQNVLTNAHERVSFSVSASGADPLSYQWALNGTNIPGATNTTLTIPELTQTNLGVYTVVVTNLFGSVTSSNATLSMYPVIVTPFSGIVTDWGENVTLSVLAWGTGPLSFQWFNDGVALANATNATLNLAGIQFTNAGLYSVVVSSPLGSATNAPAQVVVNTAGVSLGLYPGVTLSGIVGFTYDVQRASSLTDTNGWTTVATVTLTQPVQLWVDVNVNAASPTNQHYFYRVVPGQ